MGRPPFDRLMMFKILILQSLYSLSDDQMEFQITDRLTFKRFLGLKSSDKVPESKTIWNFRETLIKEQVIEVMFFRFNQALDDQSIFPSPTQGRSLTPASLKFPGNATHETKTTRSKTARPRKHGSHIPTSCCRKTVMLVG
jgi:IS5 family transposase